MAKEYFLGNIQGPQGTPGSHPIPAEITLTAEGWTGASPYAQALNIPGATVHSKIDLQPDAAAIDRMITDGVQALYMENDAGAITAYAIGSAPTVDLTMQATVLEVKEAEV